jgi:hypothetical protein
MPVTSKTLTFTAAGAVLLVVGGYTGAHALVGNEAEKSLTQGFEQVDNHPSFYVADLTIEKGLMDSTATATVGLVGVENATARVDLLLDHGLMSTSVMGKILPNEQVLAGEIDVNLEATSRSLKGQLTSSVLSIADADGDFNDLVMDVNREGAAWSIDGHGGEVVFSEGGDTFTATAPSWHLAKSDDDTGTMTYRWEVPRAELRSRSVNAYLEGFEVGGEAVEDGPLVNQVTTFKVAAVGAQGMSFGGGSLKFVADNWNAEAIEALQKAFTEYQSHQQRPEGMDLQTHEAAQRGRMIEAIESTYGIMVSNPTMGIQPFEADIALPMLGVDFKPRLTADVRFNGEELPKGVVYSMMWSDDHERTAEIDNLDHLMSSAQAEQYLAKRVEADITVTTPPEMMMGMIPPQFRGLIDTTLDKQHVAWKGGRLSVNGRPVM